MTYVKFILSQSTVFFNSAKKAELRFSNLKVTLSWAIQIFQVRFVPENKVWSRKVSLTTSDLWVWHKRAIWGILIETEIFCTVTVVMSISWLWYCTSGGNCVLFCIILQHHVIRQLSQNRKFSLKMLMINIRKILKAFISHHGGKISKRWK